MGGVNLRARPPSGSPRCGRRRQANPQGQAKLDRAARPADARRRPRSKGASQVPRAGLPSPEPRGTPPPPCNKLLVDRRRRRARSHEDRAPEPPSQGQARSGRESLPVAPRPRPLHFAPRVPESDQLLGTAPEIHLQGGAAESRPPRARVRPGAARTPLCKRPETATP